jgi:zinc protease
LDLPNNDPEVPAMMLLNAVLSRQGGRLFRILRDEKGLAYVVSSFRVTGPETGLFAIYMACEPNKVETAREGVMGILKDVIEKGVSEEELTEAKSYVLGSMEIDEQSSGHKALKMALDELLGLGYDYEEVLKERIRGIKGQDIKSVANRVLNKPYAFITVGPKAN